MGSGDAARHPWMSRLQEPWTCARPRKRRYIRCAKPEEVWRSTRMRQANGAAPCNLHPSDFNMLGTASV